MYPIPYTSYPKHYTYLCPLYYMYRIPYTLYLIPCTLYSVPYTLYHIQYTLYLILCTLYPIPYTVYSIPYTLYPQRHWNDLHPERHDWEEEEGIVGVDSDSGSDEL